MRFISTSDYKADSTLSQGSYLNRPNAYGFSRKDFKTRSLEQSSKTARRILGHLAPELRISQVNESVRILDAYLASYKNTPRSTPRMESLALACAYISVRKDGGYLSLPDIASRLESRNYRSFAGLVRRICIRLRIKHLPSLSIEESLDYVCAKVEKLLREKMVLKPTDSQRTEQTSILFKTTAREEEETSEARDLVLESLVRNLACSSEPPSPGLAKHSKQHLITRAGQQTSLESLLKAKNFALLILKNSLLLDQDNASIHLQDDVLNPIWLSSGVCSTPVISASLYFSFKLYCRQISLNDLLKATGVSKSSITKARKLLSHKLRLLSHKLFPGWLSPELLESSSELPPSILESLAKLIQSRSPNSTQSPACYPFP